MLGINGKNRIPLRGFNPCFIVFLCHITANQIDIDVFIPVGEIFRIILQKLSKAVTVQFRKGLIKLLLRCQISGVFRSKIFKPTALHAGLFLIHQVAFDHDFLNNILWDKPCCQPLMGHGTHSGFNIPFAPAGDKGIGRI